MPDEEKSDDVYSRVKNYPEIIKGVEDDSKQLIDTQNKVMTNQFTNMREKISGSLEKLHLGVIQKTVDKVVQNILTSDLKKINENINAQFMLKFNSLLGNLITNVDEVMSVGKVLDAVEKVNEYVESLNFDDALELLDLTINMITQRDLATQKQSLIDKRNEVEEQKENYHKNLGRLGELEDNSKEYQEKYHINELIAACEEIIEIAPLVGKANLINKYSPILESQRRELDDIKKDTLVTNENFDGLVNTKKFVPAHEAIDEYQKRWKLYLEHHPIPLMTELLEKDDDTWDKFTTRQEEITHELEEIEIEVNLNLTNDDFEAADAKWERADELLIELYAEELREKWRVFKSDYKIKKNSVETIRKVDDLLYIFAFEDALTILNMAIEKVIEKEFTDYEARLKKKKDDVYASQNNFNYIHEKIKKYQEKFNENYYKYYYTAAINYCDRIIEHAPKVGEHGLVEKYTKHKEEIQKELDNLELEFLKEQEELQADLAELHSILTFEDDVLPLLEKFSVDDVLGDLTGDITDSMDSIKSLMTKHRVVVKKEIANKSILRSTSGEMIQSEIDVEINKIGEEEKESLNFNAHTVLENPFEDSIEEAILTDLIPYNFEITNIEINGKPVDQLPDKTLTKDGLELKWQMENIPSRGKLDISYDLRRRISRTIVFVLEGQLKIVKTHSSLTKLEMEGFYDAELPFTNSYGSQLEGVVIEDIIPLYYLHMIKAPKYILPSEVKGTKMGELVKWDIGTLKEKELNHQYRLLELYRYEEIKIAVDALNKEFVNFLDKGELTKAVNRYHEIGGMLEEYHTPD
jgi:hypothetical protein